MMAGSMSPTPLKTRPRVCIIGGGIVGSATALFLARAGAGVTLLEREVIGSQASGVNFGGVRRHARHRSEMPLAMRSHRLWHMLHDLVGHDCDLETPGHLKLALSDDEMSVLEEWLPIGREFGLDVRLLGRSELMQQFPWLSRGVAGGSFCVGDGFANPRLVSPALARAARAEKARLIENCAVKAIERMAGGRWRVIALQGEVIEADFVVLATGAWPEIACGVAGMPTVSVARAPQMFVTEPAPLIGMPVLGLVSGEIYLRQSVRGNLIFGGGHGSIDSAGRRSRPAESTFHRTPGLLGRLIPSYERVPVIRSWTGIEGHMPDGLPVFGPTPGDSSLIQAWGFCGHGFQTGLGVGETIAELVLTGQAGIDLSAFSPSRFDNGGPVPRAQQPTALGMEAQP